MESAVHYFAVGFNCGRLVCRAETGARPTAECAACLDAVIGGGQSGHALLLQIRQFPDGKFRCLDGHVRRYLHPARIRYCVAGRHLVLYLCHDVVHA